MNRSPYRNPLDICNSVDYEAMKKNGWLDQGILVISVDDDRIGWADRQLIENIGNKLYGPRKSKS